MTEKVVLDRNLALETVRVTEAAALRASLQMGRGDNEAADQYAVDAMRDALNALRIDGTVVIGEGERDEAVAAAEAIDKGIANGDFIEPFQDFVGYSNRGQETVSDLVRYFWRYPAFFPFLLKGNQREELIRMFAGDVFGEEPSSVLVSMRESLRDVDLAHLKDARARKIAHEVAVRYRDFQGIEAAYIRESNDGVLLSFVVDDTTDGLEDVLHEYEERLYYQFGRNQLAVMCWPAAPELRGALGDAKRIYDRRAA